MAFLQDRLQCSICRATVAAGAAFCQRCGTHLDEATAQELRGVIYLLAELAGWEAQGLIAGAEVEALRRRYESRRDELSAQLIANGDQSKSASLNPPVKETSRAHTRAPELPAQTTDKTEAVSPVSFTSSTRPAPNSQVSASTGAHPKAAREKAREAATGETRRPLFETLADPYTLRILLYTGAAMLVVGIIIWLRDVLYMKLQEPSVQAALLALGTIAATVSGWLTTLRTRLRLTGRALTLIGSLLVPVNFWFLVRSGLISNNGRAWMVCALCALLYASTAALLREKLYVYLACAASIATAWSLVFRATPDAYGLYALTLMTASLIFLHLSRLFPLSANLDETAESATRTVKETAATDETDERAELSRWSYELWGPPLVRVALAGAIASAAFCLLLRVGPSPSLYDGVFRLSAPTYDAGTAMLLFVALAYVAWFTARFVYTDRRALLYTTSALALLWTEFLLLDGLRLRGTTVLLALSLTTLAAALAARLIKDETTARALHRAAAIVSIALVLATPGVQLVANSPTLKQSLALAVLGAALAMLSTPRFSARVFQLAFAHASAIFFSLAFFVALMSAPLSDESIFAMSAVLPFALYAGARLLTMGRREEQLDAAFVRVAGIASTLLTLTASGVALILYLVTDRAQTSWRPAVLFVLIATILYGALRGWRERSVYGVGLASLAVLVLVATSLDALRAAGLFPQSWPIAGGVIGAALLLQWVSLRLQPKRAEEVSHQRAEEVSHQQRGRALLSFEGAIDATIRMVTDSGVTFCAALWLASTLSFAETDRWSAAFVLLLALLYWIERAARLRTAAFVHLSSVHAGAFLLALLSAVGLERRWHALAFTLVLFPLLFGLSRAARSREMHWLARPATQDAAVLTALLFLTLMLQAAPVLRAGDELLLAPLLTVGALCVVTLAASLFSMGLERVRYFRVSLCAALAAFIFALMRAGFDPLIDVEMYTTPISVLLLIVAYSSMRREWDEYASDARLLLWTGSLLLCGPLLIRALQFRLLLDLPAPWRDVGVLCASLALVLFGALARVRAPVIIGTVTLLLELMALTLTSVHWLQVPLKVYLITAGALSIIVWGVFEYRREQLLLMRQRLHERGAQARERFSEWR